MTFNAVLLAAGTGSRLRPLTDHWPKCLMPVHGKPLLEYWLSDLFETNPDRIFINTCYLSDVVESYLARDQFLGRITIIREKELLGTGGTLLGIRQDLQDKPTLVIHADNWCGMKISTLIEHHRNHRPANCPITMMTFSTKTPQTCGIVGLDAYNVVQAFYEKQQTPPGNCANAAVYVFEPEVIKWMQDHNATDLSLDVLPNFMGRIFTVHNDSFHRDIGSLDSLLSASYDPFKPTMWDHTKDQWMYDFAKESHTCSNKAD